MALEQCPQKKSAGFGFERTKTFDTQNQVAIFQRLGGIQIILFKKTMDIEYFNYTHPMDHPTNNGPQTLIWGVKIAFTNSRQEHEEALLEECDAQLEAATHPDGPAAMTGEDGTEQEFFLGGRRFVVFFPPVWVERRYLIQRKMMQPLKRHVGCVEYLAFIPQLRGCRPQQLPSVAETGIRSRDRRMRQAPYPLEHVSPCHIFREDVERREG